MLKRTALAVMAAFVCVAVGFGAYSTFVRGGHVEAAHPSRCSIKDSGERRMEVTCTGDMVVATAFGKRNEPFTLVVDAIDNPPAGPSYGDQIIGCTLSVGNAAPRAVHQGPCP